MAYYTDKQKKYWAKWPQQRNNKWSFSIKKGVFSWAVPVFLVSYLIKIGFDFDKFKLKEFLIGLAIWALGGAVWGLVMFRITEKQYKVFLENNEDDD